MDAEASRDGLGTEEERTGLLMVELSNGMVRLYKDLFGRGPTKARTNYAGPDIIIATLENSLTRAERNMAAAGDHERLRELRSYFQYQAEPEFRAVVERVTGRSVRAFVSGMDTREDVASEVFYLHPRQTAVEA
jgi:uncharacterized protein YbcI